MPNRTTARIAILGLISLAGACATMDNETASDNRAIEVAAPARPVRVAAAERPTAAPARPAVAEVQYSTGTVAVPLKPGAPERYTVKRGDTLWDISALFLADPWLWPEIWHVNPEIRNPHLIYPGDVLRLVWIDGKPRIMLERDLASADVRLSPQVRYESLDEAIPTIPYDVIAAFLSKPTVFDKRTIRNSPYILDIRESHLVAGSGFHVYVRGTDAPAGTRYRVYHIGVPLYDPDTGRLLGHEGLYVGEGRITDAGDPATMFLTETRREALIGDRLIIDDPSLPLTFFPSPPAQPVEGRIMHVVDGVSLIGAFQIVSLNVGTENGVAPGNVLSVYSTGRLVKDRFASNRGIGGLFNRKVRLPDQYSGELMVFKVLENMSFGLIMHATNEIHVLDTVRNPQR